MARGLFRIAKPNRLLLHPFACLVLAFALCASASAQDYEKEIGTLAERLGKTLAAKGHKKVALADFTNLEGRTTEFGRFISEQVAVELVNAPEISVMDRAHLKSILTELKMSADGLTDPETAKALGKFANVDAVILGTIAEFDQGWVLTVKAISTETAQIVAANKTTLPKTRESQQLSSRGLAGDSVSGQTRERSSASLAIASKDIGDLRITLKSIQKVRLTNRISGIHCTLEITNRNLQKPGKLALNKIQQGFGYTQIRAQILDANGNMWRGSEVTGISAAYFRELDIHASGSGRSDNSGGSSRFTQIPPGQSISVTIGFESPNSSHASGGPAVADSGKLQFEFVTNAGGLSGYTLNNIVWESLSLTGSNQD